MLRASIVPLAADGGGNYAIARELRCPSNTVRKWRRRLAEKSMDNIGDEVRIGMLRIYDYRVMATERPIASERHSQIGMPPSRLLMNYIRKAA